MMFSIQSFILQRVWSKATLCKEYFLLIGTNEAMKQGQPLQVSRKLSGDITVVIIYIKGCRKKEGGNLFSTSKEEKTKITGLSYKQSYI